MKTNKEIIKGNRHNVSEIIDALEKVSEKTKLSEIGTFDSVRIGNGFIYIEENEDTSYDTIQLCDLHLHIGHDPKGCLYATNIEIHDKKSYGYTKYGKYATKENLINIRLFNDAYEKIVNKIISINKYCNKIEKNNKEQLELIKTI